MNGLLAATGAGALVLGAWSGAADFMPAYLCAWLFGLALTLGALPTLMLHALTGGGWGEELRLPLRRAARLVPLMGLLFVPVLVELPVLYSWTRGAGLRAWWLSQPLFVGRTLLYFVLWAALAWAFGRAGPAARLARLGAPGLIVYGLAISAAGVDWVMSLTPQWRSTGFGLVFAVGQAQAAFAAAVAVRVLQPAPPRPERLQDLGNLLLMYAMTWAYLEFMQFLIIWAEDLPEERLWYWPRFATGWRWLTLAVYLLQFALPVALLLFRTVKRHPARLALVALTMVLGALLNAVYLVAPSVGPQGPALLWREALALAGLGAILAAAWRRQTIGETARA